MEVEEAEEFPLPSVLKIDDTSDDNFDLEVPPTTGNEYLRRVRQEAKECPDVVVADIDTTIFQDKQTIKVSKPINCCPAPSGLAPSFMWQRNQVINFVELRQNFMHSKITLCKDDIKLVKVPSANDAESWCRLCFGRLNSKQQSVSMMENGDIESNTSHFQGSPPLVSIIAAMGQTSIVKVLHYHVNWFEATGFTSHQGQWLFALMTALQKPLIPEACSILRTLARLCSQLRATLKPDEATERRLTELNLLITLVTGYFDQIDLIEDEGT